MSIKKIFNNKNAFSFIEMLSVILIMGVLLAMTFTVLQTNWKGSETYLTRADLLQEIDFIFSELEKDARSARQINLIQTAELQEAVINDVNLSTIAVYRFKDNGLFEIMKNENTVVVSRNVDFSNSLFTKDGRSLHINLALLSDSFGSDVLVNSSTEVYPRN